ncbi:MAG: hypothetical protein DRQ13_02605 [Ignavibacteriae bacterium]|nr:MAG: hypothetical protein DRQ13_02605 [Ignavibacteriota bacterium]
MKTISFSILFVLLIALWQCSENNITEPPPSGDVTSEGSIRVILIDSPSTLDSVVICVSRVEVHKTGSDTTGGSWSVINDSLRCFDLLLLQNGASAVLGDTSLSSGKYTQIRLIVEDNNYVVDNGIKYPLTIPGGTQTGIKLNHSFEIESGKLYELYLDFNVDKSIIITGNGQYKLKPTIRVVPVVISGSISGQVLPLGADPTIWTLVGTDTASTFTDLNGLFKLMALPEGTYDVHIIPADTLIYRDTTITNVNVIANQNTDIGLVTLEER